MAPLVSSYHASLAGQAADRYPRIPFRIEPGDESVEVAIEFDGDQAVIDLGCEGPDGWRGWSGGARRTYVISAAEATPGYHPGPLEAGDWWVILGLHRLPAEGVDVTVTVTTPAGSLPDPGPDGVVTLRPPKGSSRALPAPNGLTWYAGDFHAHSNHSDGSLSLSQLAALGVESGLDFLVVSDHNTTSHHRLLPELGMNLGITLVPGQEVTSHLGHANAFGDIGWVDFRTDGEQWIRTVAERHGLLSVNHPISGDCSWIHRTSSRPPVVELWHVTWFEELISTAPLAWFQNWDRSATLIGGSDFHDPSQPFRPGCPTTWVAAAANTPEAILDAVRAGRTAISGSVLEHEGTITANLDGPVLLRNGAELVAVDGAGTILVDGAGRRSVVGDGRQSWLADPADGPYRLVAPDRSTLALCA